MTGFYHRVVGFLRRLGVRTYQPPTVHPRPPYLAGIPVWPPWSTTDRDNLARFFGSDSGKRFVGRLRATEAHNAVCAVKDVMHPAHSAGTAKGYGDAIVHMLSLTQSAEPVRVVQEPVENEEQREAREMRELLERVSP